MLTRCKVAEIGIVVRLLQSKFTKTVKKRQASRDEKPGSRDETLAISYAYQIRSANGRRVTYPSSGSRSLTISMPFSRTQRHGVKSEEETRDAKSLKCMGTDSVSSSEPRSTAELALSSIMLADEGEQRRQPGAIWRLDVVQLTLPCRLWPHSQLVRNSEGERVAERRMVQAACMLQQ